MKTLLELTQIEDTSATSGSTAVIAPILEPVKPERKKRVTKPKVPSLGNVKEEFKAELSNFDKFKLESDIVVIHKFERCNIKYMLVRLNYCKIYVLVAINEDLDFIYGFNILLPTTTYKTVLNRRTFNLGTFEIKTFIDDLSNKISPFLEKEENPFSSLTIISIVFNPFILPEDRNYYKVLESLKDYYL